MTPEAIMGTISSSMFAFGNVPMLVKAARTRSLSSYSHAQLTLVGLANLIHWFYISSLPFGPIWFLHGSHTVATAAMLWLYVRYEVRPRLPIDRLFQHLRSGARAAGVWGERAALASLLVLSTGSQGTVREGPLGW